MSFSSQVKEEIKIKYFTFQNRHSRIYEQNDKLADQAFLMELFMRCGSISNPDKVYQMEFVCSSPEEADKAVLCASRFSITAKQTERKGQYVVYLKDSNSISDMLALLGAHRSMLQMENVRILKSVRGEVQRQVNCETYNLQKMVSASVRQLRDIEYIDEHRGIDFLPEPLREAARLRMEMPDASLAEIAEQLGGNTGKSGVNHRFRKIAKIADEIRAAEVSGQ